MGPFSAGVAVGPFLIRCLQEQYHFHHGLTVPKPEGNFRDYVADDISKEET